VLLSDLPLAWLNINLFTHNSYSRAGLVGLKLWEQKAVRQAHADGKPTKCPQNFTNARSGHRRESSITQCTTIILGIVRRVQ